MLRSFLSAANHENLPIQKLRLAMKWDIEFSRVEIADMEKLLSVLEPLQKLFVRLGSESESTVHLVVPTIRVNIHNNVIISNQVQYTR